MPKFANEWDEIRDLRGKLLYWLYRRNNLPKARPLADRLIQLLSRADPAHEAILGEECWSLAHEARGELPEAISRREHEIDLIRQLHALCRNKAYEEFATRDYGYADLSDRLNILATLYHDDGRLDAAIRTLRDSESLCRARGVSFDARDLLRDYLAEKRMAPG